MLGLCMMCWVGLSCRPDKGVWGGSGHLAELLGNFPLNPVARIRSAPRSGRTVSPRFLTPGIAWRYLVSRPPRMGQDVHGRKVG